MDDVGAYCGAAVQALVPLQHFCYSDAIIAYGKGESKIGKIEN